MYFQSPLAVLCCKYHLNDLNRLPTLDLNNSPMPRSLQNLYTPTPEEIKLAKSKPRAMKGFQLHYHVKILSTAWFSHPELVPIAVKTTSTVVFKFTFLGKAIPRDRQRYPTKRRFGIT